MEIFFSKKLFNYTINCFDNTDLVRRIEKRTSLLTVGDSFRVVLGTGKYEKYEITAINPYKIVKAKMIYSKEL